MRHTPCFVYVHGFVRRQIGSDRSDCLRDLSWRQRKHDWLRRRCRRAGNVYVAGTTMGSFPVTPRSCLHRSDDGLRIRREAEPVGSQLVYRDLYPLRKGNGDCNRFCGGRVSRRYTSGSTFFSSNGRRISDLAEIKQQSSSGNRSRT